MRQRILRWGAAAAAAVALAACAAEMQGPPTVAYDSEPALVEVEPGVQVVGNADDEVFVSGGAYWVRRGGQWYSAPDYHGRWAVADQRVVPDRIRAYPAGRYRRYRRP
jgi:hypothetical protein